MQELILKPVKTEDTKGYHLYDYLFHFNAYKGLWYAFKRKDSVNYFNGALGPDRLTVCQDIKELITIVVEQAAKSSE